MRAVRIANKCSAKRHVLLLQNTHHEGLKEAALWQSQFLPMRSVPYKMPQGSSSAGKESMREVMLKDQISTDLPMFASLRLRMYKRLRSAQQACYA